MRQWVHDFRRWEIKYEPESFETSGPTYQVTQRYIPGGKDPSGSYYISGLCSTSREKGGYRWDPEILLMKFTPRFNDNIICEDKNDSF